MSIRARLVGALLASALAAAAPLAVAAQPPKAASAATSPRPAAKTGAKKAVRKRSGSRRDEAKASGRNAARPSVEARRGKPRPVPAHAPETKGARAVVARAEKEASDLDDLPLSRRVTIDDPVIEAPIVEEPVTMSRKKRPGRTEGGAQEARSPSRVQPEGRSRRGAGPATKERAARQRKTPERGVQRPGGKTTPRKPLRAGGRGR